VRPGETQVTVRLTGRPEACDTAAAALAVTKGIVVLRKSRPYAARRGGDILLYLKMLVTLPEDVTR
jgi:hypothetical protein